MKKISVMVPTYNEEENVELLYEALVKVFVRKIKMSKPFLMQIISDNLIVHFMDY